MNLNNILRAEADPDDAGGGAGGGAGTGGLMGGAEPNPTPGTKPATPDAGSPAAGSDGSPIIGEDGNFSEKWFESNEELAPYAKQLEKFNSPAALAKSYAMLEKNRAVPAEGSDEAAIEAFRKANGVPATFEEYDIKMPDDMPEGVELNEAALGKYKEAFHGLNLTPHQAQKLTEGHLEITGDMMKGMQEEHTASQDQAAVELRKEWGNAYPAKLEAAQGAFDKLCKNAGIDSEKTPFTSDPSFAKLMNAVSSLTSESPTHGLGGGSAAIKGNKQEAHEIMTNQNHPDYKSFYDAQDQRHNEVSDKVARLNK